jgi:hypothetical protein
MKLSVFERNVPSFLYLHCNNPCCTNFAWFVTLFSKTELLYAWINLPILQSIQRTIELDDKIIHHIGICNAVQKWEWRITLLLYCCLHYTFLWFFINHLKRGFGIDSYLYLIWWSKRTLPNALLQLMLVYSCVNRHTLLKVVYNIIYFNEGSKILRDIWIQNVLVVPYTFLLITYSLQNTSILVLYCCLFPVLQIGVHH